ncbi:RNA-binding protein, partial [Vibrio parahaemolyticus]|uniref:RNA recognition motif domain-containing protein n=1 Tax=Vibrio parahaemolyticus TaxID=670 RepID=UPI0021118D8A
DESKTAKEKEAPKFDANEAQRTLFLRNIPFDATRHDIFELFREFGRIEAVYLVKDPKSGVFRGTAFVRFENEKGTTAALEASGGSNKDQND